MRELIFSIYILSGLIKSSFQSINDLPVDFTLITSTLLMIVVMTDFFIYQKNYDRQYLQLLLLLLIIGGSMLISLLYTPSKYFGPTKVILYSLNILAFISPLILKKLSLVKLISCMNYIVLVCTISFCLLYLNFKIENVGWVVVKKLYLPVSIASGLSLLLVVKNAWKKRVLTNYIYGGWFAFVMILSGGRGAVLFVCLLLLMGLFHKKIIIPIIYKQKLKLKINKYVLHAIILGLLSTPVLIYSMYKSDFVMTLLKRSHERMELLFSEDKGNSVNERVNNFHFIYETIADNPEKILVGFGVGSWGLIKNNVDEKAHLHNFILEIFFEQGVIITIVLLLFLILISSKLYNMGYENVLLLPILFLFLNALKSSSFVELRVMFGFLGLFLVNNVSKDD